MTRTHSHPCTNCGTPTECEGTLERELCQCGCGLPAPIAGWTDPRRGNVKGQPQRFILGHYARTKTKHDLHTRKMLKGYVHLYAPNDPNAHTNGFIAEHILVAQAALGKPLPTRSVVHHVNGVRTDNRNSNLVICQDNTYHFFLHRRARVVAMGGNPNTDAICSQCGVSPIVNFGIGKAGLSHDCKPCGRKRSKERARKLHGFKPWRPGGQGRPPRDIEASSDV